MTNSNTKKLSVLIITLNEEEHLKAFVIRFGFCG